MSIHDNVANPFVPYPVSLIRGSAKYVSPELAQKSEDYKHEGKYDSLYVIKELSDGKCLVADGPTGFHNKTEQIDRIWLAGGPLEWDEVVKMRAATGTRILDEDIRYINKGIVDEHAYIRNVYAEACEICEDLEDRADDVERKRIDLGFNNDKDILPAYAENEIGTTETPGEIRDRANKIMSDSKDERDTSLGYLYSRVHELDVTDTREFGDKVAGRSPRGGPAQLGLLKPETREILGPEYNEYHSQRISDHIHEVGKRNIARIRSEQARLQVDNSLFGIDVSREAVAPVPEKTAEKERTAQRESPLPNTRKSRYYDDFEEQVGDNEYSSDGYDGGLG